ncbi:MAG: hypothetical protein R3A12_15090 [Ignavibacteria bacterium]
MKRIVIRKFSIRVKTKLNKSFPVKTPEESTLILSATDVSFSSSFTNVLDKPPDAEKNITIHRRPDRISFSTFSSPMANLIIEIETSTDIIRALRAYLVLNSDIRSF